METGLEQLFQPEYSVLRAVLSKSLFDGNRPATIFRLPDAVQRTNAFDGYLMEAECERYSCWNDQDSRRFRRSCYLIGISAA